ncbi:hydantoinase/oxoprolinase N-terminal domain-containing protein [Labrenzia sp. PHM005]|uniref:hydantoinase/oxoprolinase N-terminal domain-containing protein n=1 Tax=Labrenzia sp. PHM005 TaxID=2590016 RepID=UPI00114005E9|nr:hydantoinase/oxoprolinase family protein [Labrenzia sp. PHM005]QDG75506.1 hydantoinase/oxoprolinase family protein [Labrenzia sp. PHM005]
MTFNLGVDTGGTYTDAVILRGEDEVVASAKALTTRHDLAEGIKEAVQSALAQAEIDPASVGLASLSTTLATNALVEDQGARVALIAIGFAENDLERAGLSKAVKDDPVLLLRGGHNHAGTEAAPLDEDALEAFLNTLDPGVTAIAVAARFATRNPAHEISAAEKVAEIAGLPVTTSHTLSAKLNGPKRALTAVLNARLVGMIDCLIGRAQDALLDLSVTAPLMVVRGDGALMTASEAQQRPIETILSGPAASVVGAHWLTGVDTALVSDIGGTTTDIALVRNGRPAIDPDGAQVGSFRTMVEAVAMRTSGLGGDSQVHLLDKGLSGGVRLGPKRVLPVSLMASLAPDSVLPVLEQQAQSGTPGDHDGRFVRCVGGAMAGHGLEAREAQLMERIGSGVRPVSTVVQKRMESSALTRLIDRGLVQVSGVSPSDAAHVLGLLDAWDGAAARLALINLARRRRRDGEVLAPSAEAMAQIIIDQLTRQTVDTLLEAAFTEEGERFEESPNVLARHELLRAGLSGHSGFIALQARLNVDVVGLGASAPTYYPAVGERLGCRMLLPEHAGVANAIGAVVGRITLRRSGTITSPSDGYYRAHLEAGPEDFETAEAALDRLETALREDAFNAVREAGAVGIQVSAHRDVRTAEVEGRSMFIEAEIAVEASGRPRVAV